MRLAAVAAGGTLAAAAAAPALAHTEPADGFNAVLHQPHHGVLADNAEFDKCDTVIEDAGEDAELLVKEGFDVWVFNIPSGQFDGTADPIASVTFSDDGADQTVTVPGTELDFWIGPEANPHLLAISAPAGWTLVDGDFTVTGSDQDVVVTHTCAGVPDEGDNGDNGDNGDDEGDNGDDEGDDEEQPGGADDESDESLPVTGMQVGGLVALGAGLLAAGGAMLFVRRRRSVAGLIEG
jgi:LPXTG-motif cell wall-anchored protein